MISKQILESNKLRLETEVASLKKFLDETPDPLIITPADREYEVGDAWNIRNVAKHNHNAAREKLADCEAALTRMEDGTYGICIDCHKEIAEDRLQALPEAKRCTPCQSKKGLRIH